MVVAIALPIIVAIIQRRESRKPQWRLGTLHDEMHAEHRRRRAKLLAAAREA
jgi:hypothetical protein